VQSSERKKEKEQTWREKVVSCLKCGQNSADDLLGEGLARQVGNVTECALLGFLVGLGKWVWSTWVSGWGVVNQILEPGWAEQQS